VDTFQSSDIKMDGFSHGAVCEYGELCKSGRCEDHVSTSGAITLPLSWEG